MRPYSEIKEINNLVRDLKSYIYGKSDDVQDAKVSIDRLETIFKKYINEKNNSNQDY